MLGTLLEQCTSFPFLTFEVYAGPGNLAVICTIVFRLPA